MFEKSLHHPHRLRTIILLSFVAVMLWSTSIAYLWTFESAIVFQTDARNSCSGAWNYRVTD